MSFTFFSFGSSANVRARELMGRCICKGARIAAQKKRKKVCIIMLSLEDICGDGLRVI